MKKIIRLFVFLQQKVIEIPYSVKDHQDFELNQFVLIKIPDIGEELAIIKGIDIAPALDEVNKDITISKIATDEDIKLQKQREEEAVRDFMIFKDKIKKHEKEMYPVSAGVSQKGDLFYGTFTAPERIDFRDLVKDLSTQIGKRIYFEQIGVRDRAKIVGDLGKCGELPCCKRFLTSIPPVSMEAVRVQNLSSQQLENITGVCCKLKCCLNYEVDNYRENKKLLPKMKKKVLIKEREGKVCGLDILNKKVKVQFDDTGEIIIVSAEEISYPKNK